MYIFITSYVMFQFNVSLHITCNYNGFCRQVSAECPKYKEWFQVVCERRYCQDQEIP